MNTRLSAEREGIRGPKACGEVSRSQPSASGRGNNPETRNGPQEGTVRGPAAIRTALYAPDMDVSAMTPAAAGRAGIVVFHYHNR